MKIEPLDFRYDEGFRGREDKDVSPSITNLGEGGGLSRSLMVKESPSLVGGVGNMISNNNTQYHQQNRIYDSEGVALCESSSKSFNPWYAVAQRKREDGQMIEQSNREIANAITSIQTDSMVGNIRIRKLTPRECWRLMGFTDEDFDKASKVCSDSRLYSQAGNSIVVDVLCAIFGQML